MTLLIRNAVYEMTTKCEHDFRLNADGQVTCVKCFVLDDEMELPVVVHFPGTHEAKLPEFWESQVSFEE